MTMMYMYSGLPLVQYFPWSSAAFASQCNGQTCLPILRPHSNWEEYCLSNGPKESVDCPTGVLTTDQPGGGLNGDVRRREGDGKQEASTDDWSLSTAGGTAASSRPEDHGRSSSKAKGNTQLKFGIDKILGNNYVSATKTTDKKSVDKPECSSNDTNETSKRDWDAAPLSPLVACAAWRNYEGETGFTSRRTAAHHPHHHARHSAGTELQLPGRFSSPGGYCTSAYQDLSSIMLHGGTDPWSYAQYRLDHHSSLHPTEREEPRLPADLPTHPKQPHHQTILNTRVVGGRRKRSWSRAVFTSLQRKGLEKRFSLQKYVNKPDRRQLAAALGLTDAQVKVWFQNRRMKWRHSQRVQKQQRQAADTSTECPAFASVTESGTDGEDEAVDRDVRPAVSRKDAQPDRGELGSQQDGLISNKWTPK